MKEIIKYAYILAIIGILYALYLIVRQLLNISKSIKPVMNSVNNITTSVNDLNTKVNVIKNNTNRIIPNISSAVLSFIFIKDIITDFFDTKPNKRKFTKSIKRQFKYHFPNKTGLDCLKLISNFLKTQKKPS